MPDELDRLRSLRPPTAADGGWAAGPDGRRVLAGVKRRGADPDMDKTRPRWLRPVLLVTGAVMVAGVGTAAAITITASPVAPMVAYCLVSPRADSDLAQVTLAQATPDAARNACSAQWTQLYPKVPKPPGFVVCVYPYVTQDDGKTGGGGQAVIPASTNAPDPEAACAAAGLVAITPS